MRKKKKLFVRLLIFYISNENKILNRLKTLQEKIGNVSIKYFISITWITKFIIIGNNNILILILISTTIILIIIKLINTILKNQINIRNDFR